MQPSQPRPPRGFTIGIAVELFGIVVAIFGTGATYTGVAGGQFFTPNPIITGIGVVIVLIGLVMHIARV